MEYYINALNNSKFFSGCIMILMNIGGKHISADISKGADKLFGRTLLRRFFIFCMAFVSTRDVLTSIIITLLFIISFNHLLNENSKYCIIPNNMIDLDINNDGNLSKSEVIRAQRILDHYKKKVMSDKIV